MLEEFGKSRASEVEMVYRGEHGLRVPCNQDAHELDKTVSLQRACMALDLEDVHDEEAS